MTSLATLTATTPGLPCRLDPDSWYSDDAGDRNAAVRACRNCPLQQACAEYALDNREPWGVWGATTPADRRGFWSGEPYRFDEQGRLRLVCGSERAYRSHYSYREEPCEECTAAHEAVVEADRRARLAVEHEAGGSRAGYALHRKLGERACVLCLRAQARESQRQRDRGRALAERARSGRADRKPADRLLGAPADAQPFALAG